MKPGIYPVYKKSAAAQFALILPTFNEKGWIERPGAVLVEAAPATGNTNGDNPEYAWNQKITFSIGVGDLNFLFQDPAKALIHQWKGSTKSLRFQPGEGKYEGTWMMYLSEKDDQGVEKKTAVSLTSGEMFSLQLLLKAALPRMLGWT